MAHTATTGAPNAVRLRRKGRIQGNKFKAKEVRHSRRLGSARGESSRCSRAMNASALGIWHQNDEAEQMISTRLQFARHSFVIQHSKGLGKPCYRALKPEPELFQLAMGVPSRRRSPERRAHTSSPARQSTKRERHIAHYVLNAFVRFVPRPSVTSIELRSSNIVVLFVSNSSAHTNKSRSSP